MTLRRLVAVKIHVAGVVLAGALARMAMAQSPANAPAPVTPVGTWRGTSVCLVHPSACNDETVVYRIAPAFPGATCQSGLATRSIRPGESHRPDSS